MSTHANATGLLAKRLFDPDFNYEFLIFLIVCGVLAVFFLLYFNRLFASIISYGIRTYTWHRYRVYIDIQALQISLLGGRIFFTGLRYHGSNETFLIQHGDITWRYWLRRVREVDILAAGDTREETSSIKEKNATLPCRINVKLVGLEWFVYNRSPAYDDVLSGLTQDQPPGSQSSDLFDDEKSAKLRRRTSKQHESCKKGSVPERKGSEPFSAKERPENDGSNGQPSLNRRRTVTSDSSDDSEDGRASKPELPFILQLFPIHVHCHKPAVVMGNDNTRAILVVKANSLSADVDASETKTSDPYRQFFKVQFEHPVVEMKDNEEFKEDQVTRATNAREHAQGSEPLSRKLFFRHQRRRALSSLRNMVPYWRRSVESFSADSRTGFGTVTSQIPGSNHWQGLSRYLDDRDQGDKARWSSVEYAAETTILDCPAATFSIYWDVVGKITEQAHRRALADSSVRVNGSESPAWGMHLSIKGGTMNYGPWADRQRADLQRVFFPGLSKDASPADTLSVDAWRVATQFKIFIELEDTITLRIPIREQSKNWRWRGKEPPMESQQPLNKRKQRNRAKKRNKGEATQQRPPGWLEVKVPMNATVSYSMDMLASPEGYKNRVDIDLPSSELWSSINHDLLWRSGAQRISCDLSNPLSWNTLRNWHFNITSDDLELYILRDHIFLLIDLVDDWSTGPPADYLVFTPFKYHLHLSLQNLRLYINVNDENIIDKATSFDDNTYLILSSPLLKAETCIPIDKFRPMKNSIPFDIRADSLDFSIHTPQWNTLAAFLSTKALGHSDGLTLAGSYQYNATTSVANTDTLVLRVHMQSPHLYLYGFIIRYLILLKDNYFGDHVHFKTLDEYQEQLQIKEQNPDAVVSNKAPYKKSNDLDVILNVKVDDPRFMLPTNLYSARRIVQCEIANMSVDVRFTNYYMDMELCLSPLNLSLGSSDDALDSPNISSSSTQLFIDGVRVFGHRTFGLPPSEPTYLCNWDVSAGAVVGECTAEFLAALAKGGLAFGFTFDDVENALVPYSSLIFHDVTFARVNIESIRLWLHVDEAAFLFSTGTIDVNSNDWARSHYSKRANVNIPNVQLSCVNADSAAKHKTRQHHPVETEAYVQMDIHVAAIGRKYHFSEERRIQQELVRREDQRTERTQFFLLRDFMGEFVPEQVDTPAQCFPPPPAPIIETEDDGNSIHSKSTSRHSPRLSRESSFLSLSSTSDSSIRRSRARPKSSTNSKQSRYAADTVPAGTSAQPQLNRREMSGPTDHHATFHSAASEVLPNKDTANHRHSVEFSSQYFTPHFPLEGIQPDKSNTAFPGVKQDHEYDLFDRAETVLDDIDPGNLSEEHAYSSVLVEFPSGITAFVNPTAVRYANSLLATLQPSDPEDVLDSFQVGTMTDIFSAKKREHIGGDIKDLLVRLPKANIRFFNSSTLDSPDPTQEEQDQYDLLITKFALITRTTTERETGLKSGADKARTSLHLHLGSASMSASERLSSLEKPQAAMMAQIEKVTVSLGAKEITYFDADIGSITGSTASGKLEYLASLIHRTGNVATELENLLTETTNHHNDRLQHFTRRLVEDGESTNDPPFLIRPSAVLRSARRHLRSFDSWKMTMRLRQIWSTMGDKPSSKLIRDCWGNSAAAAPPNVHQLVIASFQRWRSWDLEDLPNAVLLQKIFGQMNRGKAEADKEYPILGACRLSEINFVLDPGPKQNKVGISDLNARVEKKTTGSANALPEEAKFAGPLTVLDLSCGEAAVNMNWEICELAEDVVRLYNRNKVQYTGTATSANRATPESKSSSAFHVVLEVTRGSIELETINLRVKTLSDGIRASLLTYGAGGGDNFTSLVLNCNAVTTRLHSHSQLLGMFQLRAPSVLFSHQLQETNDTSVHTIKATASSQGLTLAVKQDAIVMMEVLDLLVRDEADQLYRLKSQLPVSPTPQGSKKIADRLSSVRVNAVMFLDGYNISIPLVQSLTYRISGVVARVAGAANYGKEVIIDFDVKENSHEVQINVNNEPRSISLFQIPPTNGRITSQTNRSEQVLTVLSSIEVIQLDASAIYSLLTALNRPQISNAIEEVQQQSKVIQGHIADVFGSNEPSAPKETTKINNPGSGLVYNIHLTLAGLQIFAKTSLKSQQEPIAQILFSLDKVYLQASNRHDPQSPVLKYPELHLNVRHIGLDIRRGSEDDLRECGNLGTGVTVSARSRRGEDGKEDWSFDFRSDDFDANVSPETISTVVDVLGYLGSKIKDLDTSRELDYLRKLRNSKARMSVNAQEELPDDADILDSVLASVVYHFELRNIRICWIVADDQDKLSNDKEDLVLSIKMISFGTKTKKSATLTIEDLQLQTVPPGQDKNLRSLHSALLPEVIFNIAYVSTSKARRMAFQAVGESLDLKLTSAFIVPAANLAKSITLSMQNVREASAQWSTEVASVVKKSDEPPTMERQRSVFGKRRLENLLIDADFAGAVVYISSNRTSNDAAKAAKYGRPSLAGKYGQFNSDDSGSGVVLRSPGLAWKAEYRDDAEADPSLYGEIKIDASSNILYPSVVPLILDIMSSVKEVVSDDTSILSPKPATPKMKSEKSADEDSILTADPSAVLGRLKLNLGLRICRQEFSLSCQPIARVAATTCFENFYLTINTVASQEQGNFFAISGALMKPQASVQHVYSRESTGSFELDTVTLSFMNSKHVSGTNGVSVILKVSPMKVSINAKQVQDFLLFREIWYPKEMRQEASVPVAKLETETSQGHLVQRYQQVAATAAFPWTATISIEALDVNVDLGQAIGKSVFQINDFWVSSKKTSDWEQILCLGFDKIGIDCTGRLSGFVALQDFKLRTSIQWPKRQEALNETPLVQASLGFNALRVKASFDYQAFLVADVTSLEFLMYNVRESRDGSGDRLVAMFDGEAVQVFGTTKSAAQVVALYQAIQKLVQERRENFDTSLREIEKFMRRKSNAPRNSSQPSMTRPKPSVDAASSKSPISLDTDVVVTLKALNLGVFPSTFSDNQVFKMEALNAYTRFAASMEQGRVHSILRMTLGQLRIGLAGVRHTEVSRPISEMSVEDVVQRSTGSRGGTILKVPRVEAVMETWQQPDSNHIDYIFKSSFEGKVEVGWNYSRISYIRGMWANHSKSLEQTWGRQLPMTAVKITGVPEGEGEQKEGEQQQKITAEVNVPQSKYDYEALTPAVIETPQLRDMGEATPPLEWIGLHRERLPNLTHQIVIVSLLELAGEVEDAYSSILGSS